MRHPLVKLAGLIDWTRLHNHFSQFYKDEGRPGLSIRLIAGLHFLKHIEGLSDEVVCERWERDPYMQYFCGAEYFQHKFPCERSGMSHFRDRVGEEAMEIMLQESLSAAYKSGALNLKSLDDVAVDTTVQEKAIAHPTDHGLLLKAIEKLGESAKSCGIEVRQSYCRVAKRASIKAGRYIHARQMRRAKKQIKFLRIRLGRLIRDISRKIDTGKNAGLTGLLALNDVIKKAKQIHKQKRGDKDYVYSWHAAEVECIGKGKARKPYEFGCKASLATNIKPSLGGHFLLHAQALHGRPFDGHTLQGALDDIKKVVGKSPKRASVDRGYKGHKVQGHRTAVYITGQKRGVTDTIKKWLKKRAIIEPIIGHAKNDGLLGRNYLLGISGDKINTTLAAAGFNLRQVIRYLRKIYWAYFMKFLLQKLRLIITNFTSHVQLNLKMSF
jgi:IS5 family transposase